MIEAVGVAFLVAGSLLMLLAALGTVRMPDVFTRMHAITKAGITGVGFMLVAVMVLESGAGIHTRALMALLIVALTAPVSSHMISRAAYISKVELWEGTFIDELAEYYQSEDQESDQKSENQKPEDQKEPTESEAG